MAKLRYEVRAKTGTYKNKDGEQKNAYTKIGVVIQGDKGFMLKLETIPTVWDGWAYLNDPEEREERQPARPQEDANKKLDMDDDIPF